MALTKWLTTAFAVLMVSGFLDLVSGQDNNYYYRTTTTAAPHTTVGYQKNETVIPPHNETKAEIETSEPHRLKCQNFKVAIRLLHPPSSPRGSEEYDKMECNICDNVRLIYRCYPCFQSLKFLGINHLPDNTTAAVFIMKFGCEGKHLKVLEAILKPHSIVHAECFEPECPPESPEIHLVQPCVIPQITQCSAQICQAPESYTVTPFPTDCPVAIPPQIPLTTPHEHHHPTPLPRPPPPPPHHPYIVNSPYPDPYNHHFKNFQPSVHGHHVEAASENHKEQDKPAQERSKGQDQDDDKKEEHKPSEPQAVSVVGQTFVNGQMQPYPYPYGFPSQIPAPAPYQYGACHPACAHSCAVNCHPACCRSKFTPKTRYRAFIQKMKAARFARSYRHRG